MKLLAWVALALILCGCDTTLDRDQARFCRLAILALEGQSDAKVQVLSQTAGQDGSSIRIDYRRESASPDSTPDFVECRFGVGGERFVLQRLTSRTGDLSEPRLFMLNRFWLASDDVLARDPLPVAGSDTALLLPRSSGYALQQIVNAVPGAAIYGLLAAAYSLVYGLVGRINLAFGGFAAIGGMAALMLVLAGAQAGVPLPIVLAGAVLLAIGATALHGIVIGRLVFKPLQTSTGQQGLVATVGLALVLGEYLRLAQGAEAHWIGPVLDTPVAIARDPAFVVTITPVAVLVAILAAVTAAALLLAMKYTRFGLHWRAFSDDPRAAALFGVGRDRIFAQTFALASGLAGMAGAVTVVFFGDLGFAYATTLGLKALTAAVLGGIGSVPGALLGGLFIGLVESAWSASFPITQRDLVVYCLLVAAMVWRPGGFLGYRDLLPRRV